MLNSCTLWELKSEKPFLKCSYHPQWDEWWPGGRAFRWWLPLTDSPPQSGLPGTYFAMFSDDRLRPSFFTLVLNERWFWLGSIKWLSHFFLSGRPSCHFTTASQCFLRVWKATWHEGQVFWLLHSKGRSQTLNWTCSSSSLNLILSERLCTDFICSLSSVCFTLTAWCLKKIVLWLFGLVFSCPVFVTLLPLWINFKLWLS